MLNRLFGRRINGTISQDNDSSNKGRPMMEKMVDSIIKAVTNTVTSTLLSLLSGKSGVDEWANILVKGVDEMIANAKNEKALSYIGGELKFAFSRRSPTLIDITCELYFQDESENCHKLKVTKTLSASNFTPEALAEIKAAKELAFEVNE